MVFCVVYKTIMILKLKQHTSFSNIDVNLT